MWRKKTIKRGILPPIMFCVKKKTIKRGVLPPIMDLSDRANDNQDVGRDSV